MNQTLKTRRIEAGDEDSGFRCGVKSLDRYFAKHALSNDRLGIGRTFVIEGEGKEVPKILGFYSLSMSSFQSPEFEALMGVKLPRYPKPVVLLGRLAVHEKAQGRGLGGFLLLDAFEKALEVNELVAAVGMVVDAKDGTAQSFYEKYGFVGITKSWPKRMLLVFQTFCLSKPDS